MKIKNSIVLFVAILYSTICFGQNHKITVNDITNLSRTYFDGENDLITHSKLKEGFELKIKKDVFTKAEAKNKDVVPAWGEGALGVKSDDDDYIIYNKIIIIKKENDSFIIRLTLSDNSNELFTLKVGKDTGGDGGKKNGGCIPKNSEKPCENKKDYDNKFGEDVDNYDKDKIVYVYDFNKDPSKREFYKITKSGDALKQELANFNKETLMPGKNVKFKIYNINKFMYNVSIADSVLTFDSDPPALLTRFFLGDTTLLGSLMGTFSDDVKSHSINNENAKALMERISCFVQKYNWLRSTALDAIDPCSTFPCCYSVDFSEFLNSLSEIKAQTAVVEKELTTLKNQKPLCNDQIKLKVMMEGNIKKLNFAISKLNSGIEELTSKNTPLNTKIDKINDEIKLIESQVFFSKGADSLTKKAQLSRLETEFTAKNNELAASRMALAKSKEKRDSLEIVKVEFVNSTDTINLNISTLCSQETQEIIDALEVSDYLIKNLPSYNDIKELIVFINNMVEQNNSHTSDYISLNGNMLDLTITIASKDSVVKFFLIPEYKNDPIQIQIPIVCKPFASFSSGSFITLGKHVQNKTYAWQETVGNNNTVDPSIYTLVESGYTTPPMGFAALGNIELKLSRSIGLGGSAGVGLTIEETPRLAYLGGLSLFFGDLRQFAITGGFVGMQVNKLTNNFQTVADNQTIYTSKPSIEYYKEFKVGGFISLTYTPFKVYKTKTVKSTNK